MIQVVYDREADALYIHTADEEKQFSHVVETVNEQVTLDYATDGTLMGIEVLNVSTRGGGVKMPERASRIEPPEDVLRFWKYLPCKEA